MSSKSEKLYKEACQVLPGGVSRNSVFALPCPNYAESASGCYVTDLEGVKRVDFGNNMASLIHGHAHPKIVEAVTKQLSRGTAYAMATEIEVRMAQHICSRNSGFDKIRFVNSGTEGVMALIKVARAHTGKSKMAKFEGAYHGVYDFAEVSQTAAPQNWGDPNKPTSVPVAVGTPKSILDEVIIIPANDTEKALRLLDEHKSEIGLVLIDPVPHRVGLFPVSKDFIDNIYSWTRKNNALLGFDEVITFRTEYGGAQEMYDVRPDLTALGKIIGGGFPIGAITGRDEIMKAFDPRCEPLLVPHSGTFSANPVSMTAGLTAMELFTRDEVARVNALADRARKQLNEVIKTADVPACVTGAGSMFRVHLKPETPVDYRTSYNEKFRAQVLSKFLKFLFDEGFMLINSCTGVVSTPMGNSEIDSLCEAMHKGFKLIKRDLEGLL